MTAVLLTGVTGYIGSHLAVELLKQDSISLTVLARARRGRTAEARALAAIATAASNAGENTESIVAAAREHLKVVEGDLTDDNLPDTLGTGRYDEIWHCGAKLVFADSQKRHLEDINHQGTARMVQLMRHNPGAVFNYVSTAYVHGDCEGTVYEELPADNLQANNFYEASKRQSERLIVEAAQQQAFHYRIFRPSIVVGHSVTGKGDTLTGIYGFILLAARLRNELNGKMPGFFEKFPLRIFNQLETGVNIIPVDRVVQQMLTVGANPNALDDIYNIVSQNNVSIEQFAIQTRKELGVNFITTHDTDSLGPVDNLVNRNVEQFAPYLKHCYLFDNMKTRDACGGLPDNGVDQTLIDHLVQIFCHSEAFLKATNERSSKSWIEQMQHRVIEGAGSPLNYYVGGKGEQVLMIINAYGQSLYFWNNIARHLLDEYRVVVWEMRGTSCVAGGMNEAFEISQHIEDALTIIREENIQALDIVGWCTGPKLAMEVYRHVPDKVRTLSFITPSFKNFPGMPMDTPYEKNMEPVCRRAIDNPAVATTARRALSAVLSGKKSTEAEEMGARVETILELMNENLRTLVVAPFVNDTSLLNYARQLLNFWDYDISSLLPVINVPVLLITGEQDEIASPKLAQHVISQMPNARCAQVIGGNHYLHYEKAPLVYELLNGFIQEPEQPPAEIPGVEHL